MRASHDSGGLQGDNTQVDDDGRVYIFAGHAGRPAPTVLNDATGDIVGKSHANKTEVMADRKTEASKAKTLPAKLGNLDRRMLMEGVSRLGDGKSAPSKSAKQYEPIDMLHAEIKVIPD